MAMDGPAVGATLCLGLAGVVWWMGFFLREAKGRQAQFWMRLRPLAVALLASGLVLVVLTAV